MNKTNPGIYILNILHDQEMCGHAYTMDDNLYELCRNTLKGLRYETYQADKAWLIRNSRIQKEGRRIYLRRTWNYEMAAAGILADILANNKTVPVSLPAELRIGDRVLTDEQREAVSMALSHRLSIILGGAGTGKTTLIEAMMDHRPLALPGYVLCAATGKAARNLQARTGKTARTVHSALGKTPNDDFLSPVRWASTGICVVDEAGTLTLEMLAGILCKIQPQTHVVLVGDPNQLQSVGVGNVLLDLLELGVPRTTLHTCHRQDDAAEALSYNVHNFAYCHTMEDLHFDDSFQFVPMHDDSKSLAWIKGHAAGLFKDNGDTQVLSPVRNKGILSVAGLNTDLQDLVNPAADKEKYPDFPFREKDRIMALENDRERNVSNGDIGVVYFEKNCWNSDDCVLHCPDGRRAIYSIDTIPTQLTLAYAITVHKSQGSEYDTVVIPLSHGTSIMMYRNLIYTAISRARKRVLIVGSPDALEKALRQSAPPRRSMLVTKTHMARLIAA